MLVATAAHGLATPASQTILGSDAVGKLMSLAMGGPAGPFLSRGALGMRPSSSSRAKGRAD